MVKRVQIPMSALNWGWRVVAAAVLAGNGSTHAARAATAALLEVTKWPQGGTHGPIEGYISPAGDLL